MRTSALDLLRMLTMSDSAEDAGPALQTFRVGAALLRPSPGLLLMPPPPLLPPRAQLFMNAAEARMLEANQLRAAGAAHWWKSLEVAMYAFGIMADDAEMAEQEERRAAKKKNKKKKARPASPTNAAAAHGLARRAG